MNHPTPLNEFKQRRKPVRNVNAEHKQSLTTLERFALWITHHVGSMGFFILLFAWTVFWFLWNVFGPGEYKFDAFPSFVLWLFISNVLQLFLLPLIMVGQNLESRHSEARAEADFDLNMKSEKEIEAVLEHLEYQETMLQKMLEKIEDKK